MLGERERTHQQEARGADLKVERTEPADRTDRMEWRTSRRGDGTPRRDNLPEAAARSAGEGEGAREGRGNRHLPQPPGPAASPAHTPEHCTRQGSSGTQCHAPAPRLGSLRASPRASHWHQASSTGTAAPAPQAVKN